MTSLSHQPTIVRPPDQLSKSDWRQELRTAIRTFEQLASELQLPLESLMQHGSNEKFPLLIPRPYARRIKKGDPTDPLLLQVLPKPEESDTQPGFVNDAVGDLHASKTPGLIHKYQGRVLLIAASACAVHCRYCFRQHFPYETTPKGTEAWQPALDQIAKDDSIREVILSGGDPLMLVDESLEKLVSAIETIPHVNRLRIHTRLPIVIPSRVTNQLLRLLDITKLTTIMVIHCNHANEIDLEVVNALHHVAATKTLLLNQSVLLRGINDNVDTLEQLSNSLSDAGVTPYYLHQLDRVQGTAHFETELELGKQLIANLRKRLPGYAVPRFVVETAGEPSKTLLA